MTPSCQNCGRTNAVGASFCSACGAALRSSPIVFPAKRKGFDQSAKALIIVAVVFIVGVSVQQSQQTEKKNEAGKARMMTAYNSIQPGMTYSETATAIGDTGTENSSSTMESGKITTYTWRGAEGSNIRATFVDGKLVSKSQYGLE